MYVVLWYKYILILLVILPMLSMLPTALSDVQHVVYINLESRPDRKLWVEHQLNSLGVSAHAVQRFNAVKMPNGSGAIGCTMSHIRVLEMARAQGWPHVMVVEDDISFTDCGTFRRQFDKLMEKCHTHIQAPDVVLIAGNNFPPYRYVDGTDTCVQVSHCQTTTGYLVFAHYYDVLINNFKEGLLKLMREPHKHAMYAIDKYWFALQQQHTWYLVIPLTVTQRSDYSDIERKQVDYDWVMLDLEKKWCQFNPRHNNK